MQTPSSSIESISSHLMYGHCDSHDLSHREYFAVPPFQCGSSSVVVESRRELLVPLRLLYQPSCNLFKPGSLLLVACCSSPTWGATTLPFNGGPVQIWPGAKLLNLIKSDVLWVPGNFRAGAGYYCIINLVGPPISPLVWQAPLLNSIRIYTKSIRIHRSSIRNRQRDVKIRPIPTWFSVRIIVSLGWVLGRHTHDS